MIDVQINNNIAYYAGNAFITKEHAYPALGLGFSYQSTFEIIYNEKCISTHGVLIPPYLCHEIIGKEGSLHFIFIDIEFSIAQKLIKFFNLNNNEVVPLKKLDFPIESKDIFNNIFFNQVFDISFETLPAIDIDPRILKAIEYIKCNLSVEKMSIKEVAAFVCISESRFAHLFKTNISVPFRKYILWCRMKQAGISILNGNNFNQAAYQSGFSDPAHFSRTFTSFFGISPSLVLKT